MGIIMALVRDGVVSLKGELGEAIKKESRSSPE
jgi:hypothetical protein